ncbi:hypothetical protein DQ384_39315 [Sphaerisporangium album]|uniref:Uncharacterized protein n=1 Tax=Sphaerisporangium album TaxID=509200 RepID=A0A367EJJ6_9ACTN|nr:hypothetical protein [Sphaerisporangium album]RCG18244.1 hypothetical protein DQ384_39315 [Sphaerisporangium album]
MDAIIIATPDWALGRRSGTIEPYGNQESVYARARELPCEHVTILQRKGEEWIPVEPLYAWCVGKPDFDHTLCAERTDGHEPRTWVLRYDGGHGAEKHTFGTAGEALNALVIEARENWQRVNDLKRPDLPTEPPADDAEATQLFMTALGETYELKFAGADAR